MLYYSLIQRIANRPRNTHQLQYYRKLGWKLPDGPYEYVSLSAFNLKLVLSYYTHFIVSKSIFGGTWSPLGFTRQYGRIVSGIWLSTHSTVGIISSHIINPLANVRSRMKSGQIMSKIYCVSGAFIQSATVLQSNKISEAKLIVEFAFPYFYSN